MDWLTGNWIWALIAIAGQWFFMRRGRLRGFGGGYGMGGHHRQAYGCHRHDHGRTSREAPRIGAEAGAALDPVSGNPVRTDGALAAAFSSRADYFESDDTRKRFEAEPQKNTTAAASQVMADRPRRRRGC